MAPTERAAIGFRVKSGWAVSVLVTGSAEAPRVVDRRAVELSDPDEPATRQPHHNGFGTAQTDRAVIRRLAGIIDRCARRSLAALVKRYAADGYRIDDAVLVVGSVIDPALIANPHIRAHASEGRLFRTALEKAASQSGLQTSAVVERELPGLASRALNRPHGQLQRVIVKAGRELGAPWRAEQKAAALAAWVLLAGGRL